MVQAANIMDARLEGAVLQVIKDWGTAYPNELVAFDRQMRQLRDRQSSGGMSERKTMRHYGDIPVTLAMKMNDKFGNDWTVDRKLLVHFFNHFRVGRVSLGGSAGVYVPNSARSEM